MSSYYTGYANGSMNPFRGEIRQDTMVGREDGVAFPEEDMGRTIMDYDVLGRESQEEAEARVYRVQMTFLKDVGRYKQEGKENLDEQIKKVKLEPEEEVGVRLNLEEIIQGWDYCNDQGKVSRMAIIKPGHQGEAHNLKNWTVLLIYNEHQTMVWRRTVLEAMDDGDRYLVAWYALWRKWPLQFYNWKWAARFKEVLDSLRPPSSSYYYIVECKSDRLPYKYVVKYNNNNEMNY